MSGTATFSIFSPSPSRRPRYGSSTTAIDDVNLGRWDLSCTKDAAPVTTVVCCDPNTIPTVRALRLLLTVARAVVVVAAHCEWVEGGTEVGVGRWHIRALGVAGRRSRRGLDVLESRASRRSSAAPQTQVGLATNG